MITTAYVLNRVDGQPTGITVLGGLIPPDDTVVISCSVHPFVGMEDIYQTCLFIYYEDVDTRGPLVDIVIPDLPEDFIAFLESGAMLAVTDRVTGVEISVSIATEIGAHA